MPRHTRPQLRSAEVVLVGVLGLAVFLAALFAVWTVRRRPAAASPVARAAGIPPDVSDATAALMGLAPAPGDAAPGFALTDQHGRPVTLSGLRGSVVVLEFMDPHCTDICPIVSQEFVDAYHDLGAAAAHVDFLAVNVNPYVRTPAAMASYSHERGLDTVPSWHFVTGPVASLRSVWHHYGIEVEAPSPTADVQHTSTVFFIDPSGHERYLATPTEDHHADGSAYLPAGPLAAWGRGIATVAAGLAH